MPASQLNLLFDQIKIIEQPFGRRRDPAAFIHLQRGAVKSAQDLLIVIQPREQSDGSAAGHDLMLRGDRPRVTRELFDAKQLRPQWHLAWRVGAVSLALPMRFWSAATSSA